MSQPLPDAPGVSASDYNPMNPAVRTDPYPYYEAMRRKPGIHQLAPGLPFYAASRYDDVVHVIHHPEDFSSTAFQLLFQGAGAGLMGNSSALQGHRLIESPMMIAVDPPDHARLRTIVNRGFTPRRIAALEPRLREIADECVSRVASRGRMDVVSDFAVPFPITVIAELLGVEPGRRDQFKAWSDNFVTGLSGATGKFSREDIRKSADEMASYIEEVVAERRRAPKDDLISALVKASEGEALGTGEILSFVVLLLIAGNETTTNLIGNGVRALLQHPDQLAQVVADPSLIPQTIEETLRWDSPIQSLPRRVTRDLTLAGTQLPKDSFVMGLFASANRDDAQFPNAARFDIHRNPQGHLAFGNGIHFCLGAALARLEARVAFETLFSRCRALTLESDEIAPLESAVLRGPASIPLRFSAA